MFPLDYHGCEFYNLKELSPMTSFKLTEFSRWKGRKTLVSLNRNPIPNRPPSDVRLGCSVYLLIAHGAHQHNLVLPGRLHLQLRGKHSRKGAPGAMTGAETFYVPEDERNPQNTAHAHKLASNLKLRMSHGTRFLTLTCGLLTTHTHTISSQASLALVLRVQG